MRVEGYEDFRMDRRHVAAKDSWAFLLLGQYLIMSWFRLNHLTERERFYQYINDVGVTRDGLLFFCCGAATFSWMLISIV